MEYMITDILKLADPYLKIRSSQGYEKMSSAMNDATSYVNLRDSVIDSIELSSDPLLESSRKLLKRLRSRDLYKCAVCEAINDLNGEDVWLKSEDDIKEGILGIECQRYECDGEVLQLQADDIIVEKRIIHHGLKENNPVSLMRFLPKSNLREINAENVQSLPIAREVSESSYDGHIPRRMLDKTIRVFCRDPNPSKVDLLHHAFYQVS